MSANKIAETSTSSGTGNLTLAGAWSVPDSFITGNRTFAAFYGLNHRFPYMIQDKLGNWEKGVGYLSGAAVLVRETVVDNSLATTALVNFPAGEKLVMVPTDAGSLWPEQLQANSAVYSAGSIITSPNTCATSNGYSILGAFFLLRPMKVTSLLLEVTTLAAGATIRAGIYKQKFQGASDGLMSLVSSQGTADGSTTGIKEISISANLGQGLYFVCVIPSTSTGPTLRGTGGPYLFNGIDNTIGGNMTGGVNRSGNISANLPATLSGAAAVTATVPRIALKGAFL